ncbi:MAG: circularly permuted type 2 ATP-grasp protein [Micropruina sp.]|nr:circularly permuted type 2 ATP-grasp protein [Micropruina sp.]
MKANLGSLVIKPISREHSTATYGWQLSAAERSSLADRINAEPWAWCAQEPMAMSTAPVVTRSGLEPRRFVLRTFGVAHGDDYYFLPGGLGRVAGHIGQYTVSNYTGALAKDVWVLSAEAGELGGARRDRRLNQPAARASGLAPRVADNLYWLGRYAERAEGTSRLIKVTDDFAEDHSARPSTPGAGAMTALLHAVGMVTTAASIDNQSPIDYLRHLVLDGHRRGTVLHCARQLVDAAQHIRDLLSVDTWSVLSRLERTLAEIPDAEHQLQPQLADVLESLLALAGIIAHSMVRDESWAFLDAGTRMERAQLTVSLLRNTIIWPRPRAVDGLVVEGVLRAGESIITHRRRAAAGTGPTAPIESAIDLLLFDRINPRSVIYQLDSLAADLRLIGDEPSAARAAELAARLGEVDIAAIQEDNRGPLARLLNDLADDLRALNDAIGGRHFVRQAPRHAQSAEWATPWQVT